MLRIGSLYKNRFIEVLVVLLSFEAGVLIYFSPFQKAKVLAIPFLLLSVLYWFYAVFWYQPMSLTDYGLNFKNLSKNLFFATIIAIGGYILWLSYLYITQRLIFLPRYGGSLLVAFSLITVPLFEEFLFRGYAQNRLKGVLSPLFRVIFISVILAGYKWVIHLFQIHSFLQFCDIVIVSFIGSLVCSYALERTKSLITPIVIHIIWDSLVYISLSALPWWMI